MLHQIKAQQFYNDSGLYHLCLVLQKIVEFMEFSRLLIGFPVLFKAVLFSRTFQESPLNSSTFQACVNPVGVLYTIHFILTDITRCNSYVLNSW